LVFELKSTEIRPPRFESFEPYSGGFFVAWKEVITMSKIEQNSQIHVAMELSKGKVVTPCVSVDRRGENPEVKTCPLLDLQKGCSVGFMKKEGTPVECPEGKGIIIIGSEQISDLIGNIQGPSIPQSEYGLEIAAMELSLNKELHIEMDNALFV
jgi:hypothetical protein